MSLRSNSDDAFPGPLDTSYGRLAASIRRQILSGALKPGDRLPAEGELSATYEVSRNTAREALRILASQGLVTAKRGTSGGTFVAHPTTSQMSTSLATGLSLLADSADLPLPKIVQVRDLLEVPAAGLAAVFGTEDDLATLRTNVSATGSLDPGLRFEHNRSFHLGLLHATQNPLLELVAGPIFDVLQERSNRERQPLSVWNRVNEEHKQILGFVEAGDEFGAREAMREHLRNTEPLYLGDGGPEEDSY